MIVQFHDTQEFAEELRKAAGKQPDLVVRMTRHWTQDNAMPVRHMHVVAMFPDGDDLSRLDAYCGFLVGENEASTTAKQAMNGRALEHEEPIRRVCNELGLELRPGILRHLS